MNYKIVLHLISFLVLILSVFMGLVAGVSFLMDDTRQVWMGMCTSAGITLGTGFIIWITTRTAIDLSRREGIGIVVFGWLFAVLLGSLPFLFTGAMTNPFDAIFESTSGLTTTGASVMDNLEGHSRAILLWRACLHFLGGMGILVLVVAIIPYLGVGGMQIYRAEVTGPSKDRLTPRIASTAKFLWGVYIVLNFMLIVLLKFGGMDWFDSVCHAFATISTGGFSTRSASIAAYDSIYIETVLIIFMLLSGINFALHFKALTGRPACYVRDAECRFYLGLWALACGVIALNLFLEGQMTLGQSIRHSCFYVTTLLTCTGFGTVDYNTWPILSTTILMFLFFIGGCAGSTSGGIKQIRFIVLVKKVKRDIRSFLRPQAVYTVKVGDQIIPSEIVFNISIFFFIYLGTIALATIAMSPFTPDQSTAFSSVLSCIGNIGPGFSTVGPTSNYAHLDSQAKLILSLVMLAGRLEFYTVLVILMPTFWRK
jgi:trk system potassium uptake protein TrkH